MKRLLDILFLALLLVGCKSNETEEPDTIGARDFTMQFGPITPADADAFSRANEQWLEEYGYLDFKVWTYKTKTSGIETVMPGYQVDYIDATNRWQYEGNSFSTHTNLAGQYLKYWDESAQSYEFHAYTPATLPTTVTATCSPTDGLSLNGISGHVELAATNDYLVAKHQRTLEATLNDIDKFTDQSINIPSHYYSVVPMRFHHILSQVQFRIYNSGTLDVHLYDATMTIESPGYYNGGKFTTSNCTWTSDDSNLSSDNKLLNYASSSGTLLAANTSKENATILSTMLEIPQVMTGKSVVLTVNLGEETLTRTFSLQDMIWTIDHVYIYYISFEANGDSPILIDLEVSDFLYGDIIDNTQTNW